ncbi:MAG: hypothetical protein GEV10_10060 [Streptosporangiales bacterium]|nr:hypothetical protein [Streptosporangiales bacterium]
MTPALSPTCSWCVRGWDHCHGPLIRHDDGELECMVDVRCARTEDAHDIVVSCTVVAGCGCA